MSEQNHIIKRQTIELKVRGRAEARQIQTEVSRVYRQRIVPLIDQYCTELSDPDRIHRIELLEVDLGSFDPQHIEADLVAKLGPALRRALAEQISEQEQVADRHGQTLKATSQLELFAFFARTGSLPWWVDASQPHLLDDCLQHLIQTAPDSLRRLMRELVREQASIQRLVNHYADERLAALFALLAPALGASPDHDPQELIGILQKIKTAAGKRPSHLRQSIWKNILRLASLQGEQHRVIGPFYRELLVRVAAELETSYDSLITDIHQILRDGKDRFRGRFADMLETLYQERPGVRATDIDAISQRLTRLEAAGGSLAGLWTTLQGLAPRLPAPDQQKLLVLLGDRESDMSTPETIQQILRLLRLGLPELEALAAARLSPEKVSELVGTLREMLQNWDQEYETQGQRTQTRREMLPKKGIVQDQAGTTVGEPFQVGDAPQADLQVRLHALVSQLPAPIRAELRAVLRALQGNTVAPEKAQHILRLLQFGSPEMEAAELASIDVPDLIRTLQDVLPEEGIAPTQANETPLDLSFSDADELYIGNAGLVILWPFLSHFFSHLELLEENRFKDAAAMHRAVGLLQYIAMEEASFPEYLLPLNKVLCGMELTQVFDFGPPLLDAEIEECTHLLTAVIEQAPILRNMSAAGFRGTFLLRQGVLSSRDGAWLLRVERETYDIVLDRFPWGWEWLKLPWMEAPLRVEWS